MPENSNLLPKKRFFNAKDIDLFVNYELSRETSIIRRNSVNNIFSFSDKFSEERNNCLKFCVYGMLQSKWSDCENLKIDAYVSDSSTNLNAQTNVKNPFWFYDRNSGISALTWSFNSRKLDSINGALSKNIYNKNKASYFFPFEIDLNALNKTDGILTNKSIYLKSYDTNRFATLDEEIPFLFFDEDGVLFDFGEQTAQILESGDIFEINTDYPYLYDRHWIRQELNPQGPPFVYFTNDTLTIQEGGINSDLIENKVIPIEVSLSGPSSFGFERVKVEVVFDADESGNNLTTINFPSDALFNTNYISWNFVGESQVKYLYLRIQDDYFVEPLEKLTLRLVPIIGCVPDLNRPQIMTIYFQDNDIPSKVYFQTNSISFTEPRQDVTPVTIPITLELDRRLLVDGQALTVYVDKEKSDCSSKYGFGPNNEDSIQYFFNKNDLTYTQNLFFESARKNDIQRKIVLKMSDLTQNLVQRPTVPNTSYAELTITIDKDLDKNYTKLLIPFDKTEGFGVLRNVYNSPQSDYDTLGFGPTGILTTTLAYPFYSNDGDLTPNSLISSFSGVPSGNVKEVVYENDFDLEIENKGDIIVFDGKAYQTNEKFTVQIRSGYTTNISSGELSYNGSNYILKLPANNDFMVALTGFQSSSSVQLSYFQNQGFSSWGYSKSFYKINIKNLNFNAKTQTETSTQTFKDTNLLTKKIFLKLPNPNLAQAISTNQFFIYEENMVFSAGNSANEEAYSMFSRVYNSNSQIQYDLSTSEITSFTGSSATFYPDNLFYKGALIIPKPFLLGFTSSVQATYPNTKKMTASDIFFTKDSIVMENEIVRTGTPGSPYGGLFPVSTGIITEPISAKTIYTRFYFGDLLYQTGYGTISFLNGVQQTPPTDAFILSSYIVGASSPSNAVKKWISASPSLKTSAMIEITNNGIIPSIIEGRVVEPGQSVYISETPLGSNTGGGVSNAPFVNIVKPLGSLVLNLPTNYKYVGTKQITNQASQNVTTYNINKFTEIRYTISFLNFIIAPNRIFNHTIQVNKATIENIFTPQSSIIPGFYLRTRYGGNVLCGTSGNNFCNLPYKLNKLSQQQKKGVEVRGIIASTSTDCPVVKSEFVKYDDLETANFCNTQGFSWWALNTNP